MEIQLTNITCLAIIGCSSEERNKAQEILIDLTCGLYDFNWLANDDIRNTVCFDSLTKYVKHITNTSTFQLLESLAQYLTNNIFKKFPQIKELKIEIFKPAFCNRQTSSISCMKVKLHTLRRFTVAIAIGSNNEYMPQQQLINAIELLTDFIDNIKIGGFYETKPVGFTKQPNFYNTVITGTTTILPNKLLSKLKQIEKLMGKQELIVNGPRIIDLDLLLVDNLVYINNFLEIPHKKMHERDFVLKPLADIAPEWQHPVLNQSVQEMLDNLNKDKNNNNIIAKS